MSARTEHTGWAAGLTTRTLLIAAMALTVVVLVLTVAVVATSLGPRREPVTLVQRDLQRWRSVVAGNPDAAWAHTGLGVAQLEARDEAGARRSFERALELDPDDWTAGFRLGTLLVGSDAERAEVLLVHAGKIAPPTEKVGPYLALGDLRLDAGDPQGARSAYETAVADAPHIVEARVGLARALEAAGHPGGALEQYREAARYDPSDPKVAAAIARLEQRTPSSEEN